MPFAFSDTRVPTVPVTHSGAERVFQSRPGRVAGGPARPVRDRRPAHAADQTQALAPAVRDPQPRRRGRRVSLPAHPLAPVLSLRGDPPPPTRGADQPTDALQAWPVPLPGSGHEPPAAAAQPVALLQRPCRCRVAHQAAQGRLRPGQHSDALYFHLLLLAYNLVNWFKRLCLPSEFQNATLQTLRERILLMPAQLRRSDNRPRLILPASGPREAAWKYALQRIERVKP
jgi:Transposase DDE domain group 1